MKSFIPDYTNLMNAARNKEAARLPLYEHFINEASMSKYYGENILDYYFSNDKKDNEYFYKKFVEFFLTFGYDTVSFERCIGPIMPDSGSLGGHKPGVIQNKQDFLKYPWDSIKDKYFDTYGSHFEHLRNVMPAGMKAVGGVGNGVFECVQDVVGYTQLCYISIDDPELYVELFSKVGDIMYSIWEEFLVRYGDIFTVVRFGDDLGFKSTTLLSKEDIVNYIIPQYKRITDLAHKAGKPFILHSCGNIFNVMDEIINIAGIDAKHSNEDQIAPFTVWVDKYGDKIGNFGGVDVDVLCQRSESEIKAYVKDVIAKTRGKGGIAIGSGNSIPEYVPTAGFIAMTEAVREARGE